MARSPGSLARRPLVACLPGLLLGACVASAPEAPPDIASDSIAIAGQAVEPQTAEARRIGGSRPEALEPRSSLSFLTAPSVEGDRLWANLVSLTGQRYWADERAATRQQLTATLTALGWNVKEQAFEQGVNLIATHPVSRQQAETQERFQEQILVGAHYDTVQGSPGADDNATGVAVLLELAALYGEQVGNRDQGRQKTGKLAEDDSRPRALTLVFFDQEEQGLLGSLAFTAEPENSASLALTHGAVVLDMLGASCGEPGCQRYPEFLDRLVEGGQLSDRGDFIAVVGETQRPDLLGAFGGRNIATGASGTRSLPTVLPVPVPFKGLLTPDVLRSDHAAFWLNGVGAVLVTDTANLRNPHYHQPSDSVEQIARAFFEGVAQQVVNGVWRLLSISETTSES